MSFTRKLISRGIPLLGGLAVLAGCADTSPKYTAQPEKRMNEQIVKTLSNELDILFIIDDSGSMNPHQANLEANMDLFMRGISHTRFIDYHIGAISTAEEELNPLIPAAGPGGGRLAGAVPFVTRGMPDALNILKKNVMMGTSGSAFERVFSPMKLALSEPNLSGWNKGFYREKAHLAIIVITDAEDQTQSSFTRRPPGTDLDLGPQEAYEFLLKLKSGDKSKIATYGAIIRPDDDPSVCPKDDSSSDHSRLLQFFEISEGVTYGLCDPDFGMRLAEVAKDIARRISPKHVLDRRPKLETITVLYGDKVIPPDPMRGWTYEPSENSISFGPNVDWGFPESGTRLQVLFDPAD